MMLSKSIINYLAFLFFMTDLVACLSSGKGTWSHISLLIKQESWDNVFLVTNEFGRENFQGGGNVHFIVVDFRKPLAELIGDIIGQLKGRVKGIEVAVNLVSGTGKEHMAIMSALLKLGLGIRFVVAAESGVREI
jgi:hypothetical protein